MAVSILIILATGWNSGYFRIGLKCSPRSFNPHHTGDWLESVQLLIRTTNVINIFSTLFFFHSIIFSGKSAKCVFTVLLLPHCVISPEYSLGSGMTKMLSVAANGLRANTRFRSFRRRWRSFFNKCGATNTDFCIRRHPFFANCFATRSRNRSFSMS